MRKQLTAAALAVAVTACTATPAATPETETTIPETASEADTNPTAVSGSSTETASETTVTAVDVDETSTAEPDTSPAGAVSVDELGNGAVVNVDTESLPAIVVDAVKSGGGELAATDAWTTRYPLLDLPVLDGNGVQLIEANLDATPINGGWQRVDEMQWLLNASGTSRDEILAELVDAAGVSDWAVAENTSIVDAAECVERDYTSDDLPVLWTVQGCQYPTYPGMVAIGISHSANTDDAGVPPFVDPSVGAVVDAVDGTIDRVTVTFGAPATSESTATLVTTTEVTASTITAGDELATTALANWTRTDDEGGAVVFSGAPGTNWVAIGDSVNFTSEGRLAP